MDTKWKNRRLIAVWSVLFTFGLSGILAFFIYGGQYIHRDYFHTMEFQSKLDTFAGYVGMFELNDLTVEEAKKTITVTEDEIKEHRYRYGTLPAQIDNIKSQYEERIQGATDAGNQAAAEAFTTERDSKIEDITKNFKSDDYVRPKVVQEKEKRIAEYYKKREAFRTDYLGYKKAFTFYFKNTETGKVFTNLQKSGAALPKEKLNEKNMLYVSDMTVTRDHAIHFAWPEYEELANTIMPTTIGTLEGQIAVPKSLSSSSFIMTEYKNYQQAHLLVLIYSLAGVIALIGSLFVLKRSKTTPIGVEKWRHYYNKLPIDSRILLFIVAGITAMTTIYGVSSQLIYVLENPYDGVEMLFGLILASCAWGYTFVQWKYLIPEIKDLQNLKKEWRKAIVTRAGRKIKVLVSTMTRSLKDAFLNRSMGTQLFIVLAVIFGLGTAPILVIVHPVFIIFYLLLLAFIGIPIVMILVKKIGYFNQIVEITNELAAGNLGGNLQVTGRSVLAELAGNINVLKQGVKHSQKEQAKSERLKTELITNVSHDLRTPLTSIITYTELLKTQDVSSDERAAYLEIIDRKSKRLKVLIDDLFEVSKMASGNIDLKKEKVDLVQLLQQALGEYDDTIKESTLQFRVTNTEKPVYALVDGQKLWRVFDNLIGNILKYSIENSRVYITISKENGQAMIIFKNVSKYELNENSDELYERFKRGDRSRHTEGSGLGLAIAKSIVDLHEGRLDIETDGDLFKVCILLNLEE